MKQYIGNGKQRPGAAFIEVTLCMDELLKAETFTFKGKTYLKCIVAPRRDFNAYDNTHTVYVPERDRQSYNDRLIDEQERRE